ncbi:hypothetical protein ACEPPN_017926 [Leptodophora sp. 'Broadleaf-Isolate-01']
MHLSNVPTTENTDPSNLMTGQSPNDQEPCSVLAQSGRLQSSANSDENDRWTDEFNGGEEITVPGLDESDSGEDIYDDLTIPSYVTDDAADLSQCYARP